MHIYKTQKDVLAVQTGSSQVMENLSLTNLHTSQKKIIILESPYTIPAFTANPTVCMWALQKMDIMHI